MDDHAINPICALCDAADASWQKRKGAAVCVRGRPLFWECLAADVSVKDTVAEGLSGMAEQKS